MAIDGTQAGLYAVLAVTFTASTACAGLRVYARWSLPRGERWKYREWMLSDGLNGKANPIPVDLAAAADWT